MRYLLWFSNFVIQWENFLFHLLFVAIFCSFAVFFLVFGFVAFVYPDNTWWPSDSLLVRKECLRHWHSVWKSPKKSHSLLRAKRATFTFWVDKSSLKMPKLKNSNQAFWIIFKHCGVIYTNRNLMRFHKNERD